jgi:hypothetical protein
LDGPLPKLCPVIPISNQDGRHTFWLKIEQFWPFEEISIFSNSSHLEWRAVLSDTILKGTHPGTIPPVMPTSNQDGHQAKNRKKGG